MINPWNQFNTITLPSFLPIYRLPWNGQFIVRVMKSPFSANGIAVDRCDQALTVSDLHVEGNWLLYERPRSGYWPTFVYKTCCDRDAYVVNGLLFCFAEPIGIFWYFFLNMRVSGFDRNNGYKYVTLNNE